MPQEHSNYIFRLANEIDISAISQLNNKWLQENIPEEQKYNGFLTCDPFSSIDLKQMISRGEIALAEFQRKIVAYYLFDNDSNTATLQLTSKIISNLSAQGIISEFNLAKRAQVVIDTDFQGTGLYKPLISYLHKELSNRYNSVFSIVYKNNPKIDAHIKVGWKIVSEDGERYFVIHSLK